MCKCPVDGCVIYDIDEEADTGSHNVYDQDDYQGFVHDENDDFNCHW